MGDKSLDTVEEGDNGVVDIDDGGERQTAGLLWRSANDRAHVAPAILSSHFHGCLSTTSSLWSTVIGELVVDIMYSNAESLVELLLRTVTSIYNTQWRVLGSVANSAQVSKLECTTNTDASILCKTTERSV